MAWGSDPELSKQRYACALTLSCFLFLSEVCVVMCVVCRIQSLYLCSSFVPVLQKVFAFFGRQKRRHGADWVPEGSDLKDSMTSKVRSEEQCQTGLVPDQPS